MTGRTSARSSAKRDQASSPPKGRAAQSTRSTRSQSRELGGDSDPGETKRRGARRGTRASSEDSVSSKASSASNASGRGGRTRKATRGAAANRDLSMVAEDREEEQEEEEDDDDEDQNTNKAEPAQSSRRSQSPGVMSQMSGMSGTTAISAITSHSAIRVAELDPMMAEILPELLESSVRIMDLLAPAGTTYEIVDDVVRELKTPGSRRSKKLRFEEDKFKLSRDHYGKDNYIISSFVLRRLLGDNPGEGAFRPDAVLHAANLATLVKEFTVIPKESESMRHRLMNLDLLFPEPFVYKFNDEMRYGSSMLLNEAFELGLNIRTQWTIHNIYHSRGQEGTKLEDLLAEDFFDLPGERDLSLQYYDDYVQNGRPKDILRGGPANSPEQAVMIINRVNQIYEAFNQGDDDAVDFDFLEKAFDWSEFLAELVLWSRSRLNEISRSIREQGGIQTITETLIDTMRNNDSQIEINYEPPPTIMRPRELLPSANITQGVPGKSLYDGKASVGFLKKLKKRDPSSLDAPPSNQKAVSGPSSSRLDDTRPPKNAPERTQQIEDDYRPLEDDDDFGGTGNPRPTQDYVGTWNAWGNEKNKENRPLEENPKPPRKRRLVDRQPDAKRLHFDDSSQEAADQRELSRKRSHEEREATEESEDEGFEEDRREPDPARRIAAPVLSPKRRRKQSTPSDVDDDDEAQLRSQEQLQADARRADQRRRAAIRERERQAELEDDDDSDDEDLQERGRSYSQVASTARINVQKATMKNRQPQKRTKWSLADEQHLIDLIEEHGCSWSLIQKAGDFDMDRDQVALKDKARNMKVTFLKARTTLPLNFELVPLGAKELRSVRAVVPDYEG